MCVRAFSDVLVGCWNSSEGENTTKNKVWNRKNIINRKKLIKKKIVILAGLLTIFKRATDNL